MSTLSVTQRRLLSAKGHTLSPVVLIGKAGLTNNVIAELDRGLLCHELIKVKVQLDDRNTRKAIYEEICHRLNAEPIQQIGKIFIIYRPKPEETEKPKSVKQEKREPRRTKRSYQT
ncbi:MAG: ribosome assembly RNA-binding protein YhbY [Nitrosomonas sp.]|nr:ribosome assembly RNA-binding protein YhbY [Nitrosomonas sp.]MCW5619009.1 ribosome assembly RNA-binding protein YhbY [Nitrosomonas sp.]